MLNRLRESLKERTLNQRKNKEKRLLNRFRGVLKTTTLRSEEKEIKNKLKNHAKSSPRASQKRNPQSGEKARRKRAKKKMKKPCLIACESPSKRGPSLRRKRGELNCLRGLFRERNLRSEEKAIKLF